MSMKESMDKLVSELKTQRDELNVRMHLAKAEIRDEWEDAERKWEHLESRLEHVGQEAKESAEEVGAALSQLGEELGEAYKRIRKSLD